MELTQRERETLSLITDAVLHRGFPPSVRELATQIGCSPPTALEYLRALEVKGHIERVPGSPRAIRIIHS